MSEDQCDAVSEVGHTTNENGMGFGLAIVHRLANAHGWEALSLKGKMAVLGSSLLASQRTFPKLPTPRINGDKIYRLFRAEIGISLSQSSIDL